MRPPRTHLALAFVLFAVMIGPVAGAWHGAAAAPAGRWTRQVVPGPVAIDIPVIEIQCPSLMVCYALRSTEPGPGAPHPVLQTSTNGGLTWTAQQINDSLLDTFSPTHLACPDIEHCYLPVNTAPAGHEAKLAIRITSDGGKTWTDRPVGVKGEIDQISCPRPTDCYVSAFVYASGAPGPTFELLSTHDGGRTWITRKQTISNQPLFSLTCPGVADCYLAGYLFSAAHPKIKGLKGIAATHDGGRTWTVHIGATPTTPAYNSLTCPTALRCYALGDAGLAATTNGGKTWNKLPARSLRAGLGSKLVCAGPLVCYLAQGQLWRTADGGVTWSVVSGSSAFGLHALSCPRLSVCYAANSDNALAKTIDGRSWYALTPHPLRLDAVACPTPATCVAVGYGGTVLTTTNGGTTWVRRMTGIPAYLVSLACTDLRTCLVGALRRDTRSVGPAPGPPVLLRTSDGGQTWKVVPPPKGTVLGPALTCPSSTTCYDAGSMTGNSASQVVLRSGDGGRTWTAGAALPKGYNFTSLACATVTRCVGVGGVGPCIDDLALRSEAVQPFQVDDCRERGWLFDSTDGIHWSLKINRTLKAYDLLGADLVTAFCPTANQCFAAGLGLWVQGTPGAAAWTIRSTRFPGYAQPPERSAQPTDFIQSLSCPGPSTCWGIGVRINSAPGIPVLTTDGGRHWQAVDANVPLPNDYAAGLTALACPGTATCVAVGGDRIMKYAP